ncbi:MAG: FAD:protein FMN transferase [Arcobacter sp.]|nr:FAD:protein FMN transferase [Arcobacter sp.]
MRDFTRRNFIGFSLFSTACVFFPKKVFANSKKVQYKSKCLGANSSITIYTKDEKKAQKTIYLALKEVNRLENIFSLFRSNSDIVKLNKNGFIDNPKNEFFELISFAQKISKLSDGYFDITVQNLWIAHKRFSNKEKLLNKELEKMKSLISWRDIKLTREKISFKQKGMKITLNAIAQGYITDKITEFFKNKGFENILINFGEYRSFGKASNRNWRLSINNTKNIIDLNNRAISTSSSVGTKFNEKYHHLFNPKTYSSSKINETISVVAPNATIADALSTTLAVMPKDKREKFLKNFSNIKIYYS